MYTFLIPRRRNQIALEGFIVKRTYAVVVPTLNAESGWPAFEAGLKAQNLPLKRVVILDSNSSDCTQKLAAEAGFEVIAIPRIEFNHGGTRQLAVDRLTDIEVVIYLTQDAILNNAYALRELVNPFDEEQVGATYGRQLPRPFANSIEAHARLFNYPETSRVQTWEDRHVLGIKTTFLSNSCSAYRRKALQEVGGFQKNTIFAEDSLAAAKMLMSGWKIVYVSAAQVVHSHDYKIHEEFSRYFDIGVFHHRESWLLEEFGAAGGEGMRYVMSELRYVAFRQPFLIPEVLARTAAKWVGYKLGSNEERLPANWRRKLSMHKRFWDSETITTAQRY
jgi:rhamnosyltransferase